MSYEIIYDKLFIKAEKNNQVVIFPTIESGSNNCYDVNRFGKSGRRARDWNNCTHILMAGNQYGTIEEVLAGVQKWRDDTEEGYKSYSSSSETPYDDDSFGWHVSLSMNSKGCAGTSFKSVKNFYQIGCDNALSVEQLKGFGINVRVYTSFYSNEDLLKIGQEPFTLYPSTSEELIKIVDEKTELFKDTNVNFYITLGVSDFTLKNAKASFTSKKSTLQPLVSEFFKIKILGSYFIKRSSRMVTRGNEGKKFLTEKSANKVLAELKVRLPNYIDEMSVEKIELDTPIYL